MRNRLFSIILPVQDREKHPLTILSEGYPTQTIQIFQINQVSSSTIQAESFQGIWAKINCFSVRFSIENNQPSEKREVLEKSRDDRNVFQLDGVYCRVERIDVFYVVSPVIGGQDEYVGVFLVEFTSGSTHFVLV